MNTYTLINIQIYSFLKFEKYSGLFFRKLVKMNTALKSEK